MTAVVMSVGMPLLSPSIANAAVAIHELPLPGEVPNGVNNHGQVIGQYHRSEQDPIERGFIWTPGGTAEDLGTLGGEVYPAAINDAGQVAGVATGPDRQGHAFLWTPGTGMRDLDTAGCLSSTVTGLNDKGQVIGECWLTSGTDPAFRWTQQSQMHLLPVPAGAVGAHPTAINDLGEVVGFTNPGPLRGPEAFRWTEGGGTELIGHGASHAMAINNRGQVTGLGGFDTGFVWTPPGSFRGIGAISPVAINDRGEIAGFLGLHAARWTTTSGLQDLGALSHDGSASVVGLDRDGHVVGTSITADGSYHGYRWTAGHGMQDLGTLGGGDSFVTAISSSGLIAGYASGPPSGEFRPVLWTDSPTRVLAMHAVSNLVYGHRVTVTGRLVATFPTTVGVAGQRMALYRRLVTPSHVGRWWRLAVVTTDARGYARWRDRPPVNVQYQWRAIGAGLTGVASRTSSIITVKVATHISARVIRSPGRVSITGVVAPNHAFYRVWLQQWTGSRWATVAGSRLSGQSRYSFAVPQTDRVYRVRMAADPYHISGTSRVVAVRGNP